MTQENTNPKKSSAVQDTGLNNYEGCDVNISTAPGIQEDSTAIETSQQEGLKADHSQYTPPNKPPNQHVGTQTENESPTVDLNTVGVDKTKTPASQDQGYFHVIHVEPMAIPALDHLETEELKRKTETEELKRNKSQDLRKTSKYHEVAEMNFTCPEADSKSLLRHHRKRCRNGTMKNVTDVLKILLLIGALLLVVVVLVISISVVVIYIVPRLNNPHDVNTGTFPPIQTEPSTFTPPLPSPILTMLMTTTTMVPSNTRALTNHRCTIGRMEQTRCQVKGREELLTCSDSIGTGCTSKDGTECTVFECRGMIKSGDQFECGLNEELMLSSTRQYVKHC